MSNFPGGVRGRIGVPASPDPNLALSISRALLGFSFVQEAHLPMVFDPQVLPEPSLVLFLLFTEPARADQMIAQVSQHLSHSVSAPGGVLNIVPLMPGDSGDSLLHSVQMTHCRILSRSAAGEPIVERPWTWWKLLFLWFRRNYSM